MIRIKGFEIYGSNKYKGDIMKMVYSTANEKKTFSYVEVPKALFADPALKSISSDAKLLYGLMLDRMHLSRKNGWLDADGRVYIYYTLDDAMEVLGCSKNKVLKTFDELDEGVGLIRREKQGMGKPTVIYVRTFDDDAPVQVQDVNVRADGGNAADAAAKVQDGGFLTETPSARNIDISVLDEETNRVAKEDSKGSDYELEQVHGMNPNKTETNKPEKSNLIRSMAEIDAKPSALTDGSISSITSFREQIQQQISYEVLAEKYSLEREMLDGIVDLMLDVRLTRKESIIVAKDVRHVALVQERFRRIDADHVEYVLDCMLRNTTKIRNIKSYLLTALYNAPSTISSYYRAEANHDLAKVAG